MTDNEKLVNFMSDIQRLRDAGYKITDSEAYDLFAKAIADGQQTLGLGQGILPEASGERSSLPILHQDE